MMQFTSESKILRKLASMRRHGVMTDLTLVCGTASYPIHKLVLAASSSYFDGEYFTKKKCNVDKESRIVFPQNELIDLENIITYMYKGQIQIPEIELPGLLKIAKAMRIDGLREELAVRIPVHGLVPQKSAKSAARSTSVRLTLHTNEMNFESTTPATTAGSLPESRRKSRKSDFQDNCKPIQNNRRGRKSRIESQSSTVVRKTACRNVRLKNRKEPSVESRATNKMRRTGRGRPASYSVIKSLRRKSKTLGTVSRRSRCFEPSFEASGMSEFQPIISSTRIIRRTNTPRPHYTEILKAPSIPANPNARPKRSGRSRRRITIVAQKASSVNGSTINQSYLDRNLKRAKLRNEAVMAHSLKAATETTVGKRFKIGEVKNGRRPCKMMPVQSHIVIRKDPKELKEFKPKYSSTLISEVRVSDGFYQGKLSGKAPPVPATRENQRPLERLKSSKRPIPQVRRRKSCRSREMENSARENEKLAKNLGNVNLALTDEIEVLHRKRSRKPNRIRPVEDTTSSVGKVELTQNVPDIKLASPVEKCGRKKEVGVGTNLGGEKRKYYNTRARTNNRAEFNLS